MTRRMPILREDHVLEAFGQRVDRRDHGIAVRHGERPAGEEVVLDVDDDEDGRHCCFIGGHCHDLRSVAAKSLPLKSNGASMNFASA